MTDYLAAFLESPRDLKHYGRRGMKWGQRIFTKGTDSKSESKSDTPSTKAASSSAPAKRPPGNIQDNVESSSARYDRLANQARTGRASDMTEQDLKFFNARTEALAKINKLNEVQPSWLRETATKVVQQSAQRQMQGLADAITDKYIGDPIKAALKGAADSTTGNSGGAKKSLAPDVKKIVDKVTDKPVVATKSSVPGMTKNDAIQFFRDNPIANRPLPKDFSPSGNFDLFKTLREEGLIDD